MKKKNIFIIIGCISLLLVLFFAYWEQKHFFKSNNENLEAEAENKSNIKFVPKSVPSGNKSEYAINLALKSGGRFHVDSTVRVTNTSSDTWNKLIFYFIPNMFTKENSPNLVNPATNHFNKVTVNGKSSNYSLVKDALSIPLNKKLKPNQEIQVDFSYDFTLPKKGLRFTEADGNYYLAQFYPMISTYRNHQWNKEPYKFSGETYHTAFSDFKVTYKIPKSYTITSTNENDHFPIPNEGSFEIKKVKEVFIALLKEPHYFSTKSGNTTIRVFGNNKSDCREISKEAATVFNFYQKTIGSYPFKQLDIVLDTMGMEYPGIVTAGSIYTSSQVSMNALKTMVDHEIAHQWFYSTVSNDPYNNAWLDEGFVTFAQTLYYASKYKETSQLNKQERERLKTLKQYPVNLPLDRYKTNQSSYIYGKTSAMLWIIFEKKGGIRGAEKFLKDYYHLYSFKEVNTQEFVRFAKHYFNLKSNSIFKEWLSLKGDN